MKNIALIGCTGSIGRQVIKTVERLKDCKIVSLVANSPSPLFNEQVKSVKPLHYALASENKEEALNAAALDGADIIFNAAGGFAGLEYSLRAVSAGKTLALANKETLVCGGELINSVCAKTGAEILPVDSEHSAIWQCLHFDRRRPVKRLIITASGGAFRGRKWEELKDVTCAEALNHPTWKMGKKITIDSATMANKGYEVIEAHVLYGVPYENIEAVIQPQSIVHSLAEFEDGSILAQMSYPTMELPIQLALTYPQRKKTGLSPLNFKEPFTLSFSPLKDGDFPLYNLAVECGKKGGAAPCVFNAADEVAVGAFLAERIKFTDIFTVVKGVVEEGISGDCTTFEGLKCADAAAREKAARIIKRL